MNNISKFRTQILPWTLYAVGVIATIAAITFKLITLSNALPVFDNVVLIVLGFILGLVFILVARRQKISRKEYLNMKFGTIFCWICCVLVFLTISKNDWVYYISLPIACGCIPYVGLYLPRYLVLKAEQDAFNRYLKDPDAKLPPGYKPSNQA